MSVAVLGVDAVSPGFLMVFWKDESLERMEMEVSPIDVL